ncbi:hypothetical protein NQ318_001974 [Aromia moschata]|uniref:DUF4773 domain-containing protein n=1 Tax=Aromia moschata TaxID=1265417 RepID=A0AAV8Z1P3_9CUCU|nr:hypothetical protein NQ318_001974 [Aromia moschata]
MPLRMTSLENILRNNQPWIKNNGHIGSKIKILRRIGFRSNGCTCQELTCGCCLGINLNQFNFSREGCMNFTYDPFDFSVGMDMYMNQDVIYSNSFSAHERRIRPPLCLPIVIPYIPIQIDACARLYDIYTPGRNLHMCFDFEMRIQQATLLILHFDCMRMGSDGLALVKPGDMGGLPTTTESQVDSDIYDEVTEIKTNLNGKRKIYKSPSQA